MAASKKNSLQKMLGDLEQIVASLESDEFDLEESVKQYEKGLKLASSAKEQLTELENKVEKIKKQFSGNAENEK